MVFWYNCNILLLTVSFKESSLKSTVNSKILLLYKNDYLFHHNIFDNPFHSLKLKVERSKGT